MTYAFTARIAGAWEEHGVLTAGVGEENSTDGRSLLFMAPLPDDDDTTLCVCNEQGAAAYGAAISISLRPESLVVRFRAGTGIAIGFPDETEIPLEVSAEQLAELADALRIVVGRSSDPPELTVALGIPS